MAKRVLSPAPAVVEATAVALASGPMEVDLLVDRLSEQGVELGLDPDQRLFEVLDEDRFVELDNKRLVDVLALADGTSFTHELTADDVATGKVDLEPDLVVLASLQVAGLKLSSPGGPLDCQFDDKAGRGVLVGPDGWLGAEAPEGSALTVTVEGRRTDVATTQSAPPSRPDAVAALRRVYADISTYAGTPIPISAFHLWIEAVSADPEAFRGPPQAPLGRLLEEAGLQAHADHVGPQGHDWQQWEVDRQLDGLARRWRLDHLGLKSFVVLAAAFRSFVDKGSTDSSDDSSDDSSEGAEEEPVLDTDKLRPNLGRLLSYDRVAPAFVGELLGGEADREDAVASFAEMATDAASSAERAGPLWVRSICAERAGNTLDAEALLAKALAARGDYLPAVRDAAWYAADRGDVRRAASLLRRTGDEADDDLLEMYDLFAKAPAATAGRNDPCPCGSGRKYKFCHLGRESLPLPQRALFLHQKGVSYLERGGHLEHQLDIAFALVGGREDPEALGEALRSALISDLALFEDGVWNDFVRDRGVLLPPDELALAQKWQEIQRSVHQIQAVRAGEGVTVENLRTGETIRVTERGGARQLSVGDLICARIVPVGDGQRILGGFEVVAGRDREELLALLGTNPSGTVLAAWFGMIAERNQVDA